MAGQHWRAEARRVVAGVDADGRSAIVSDGNTTPRVATDAFTICQIGALPPHVLAESTLGEEASITPPSGGFTDMVTTFPGLSSPRGNTDGPMPYLRPGARTCYWGGVGGSMVIMDLERRVTIA